MTRNSAKTLTRMGAMVTLAGATWYLRSAHIPTWAQGVLMVLCAVLIGDLGMKVARRLIALGVLRRHSAAQAAIFAVVGTVYGLIAAFVIVVVWESYSTAETTVSQESNALADLERMSRGFDIVTQRQVQGAARAYAYLVIHEEWPAMDREAQSERVHASLVELWRIYTDMASKPSAQWPIYDHSIERLGEIDDARKLRLEYSKKRVPSLMWIMLYAGGFATVVLAYFFESPTDWFHRIVIALLSLTIMFSMFLVAALERPFHGDMRIDDSAFVNVLESMQNLER